MQVSAFSKLCSSFKAFVGASTMVLTLASSPIANADGLGFDKTRLIISDGQNAGSVVLDNRTDQAYFVRAHLEDSEHVKTTAGMVRPPIFEVKPQQAGRMRVVIDQKSVPTDRETMFWLYTKSYPAKKPEDNKQKLNFNFIIQMKVFYRPEGLKGTLLQAAEKLQWRFDKDRLMVKNDSPFNISLVGLKINDKPVDTNKVVKPFSEIDSGVKIANKSGKLFWYIMNDFGGVEQFSKNM